MDASPFIARFLSQSIVAVCRHIPILFAALVSSHGTLILEWPAGWHPFSAERGLQVSIAFRMSVNTPHRLLAKKNNSYICTVV